MPKVEIKRKKLAKGKEEKYTLERKRKTKKEPSHQIKMDTMIKHATNPI